MRNAPPPPGKKKKEGGKRGGRGEKEGVPDFISSIVCSIVRPQPEKVGRIREWVNPAMERGCNEGSTEPHSFTRVGMKLSPPYSVDSALTASVCGGWP